MLEAAAIKFEMIKTTRPLEALEYCRDLEERKDLIMIVGGDGSVSEVVRGLYQGGTFFGDIPLSHIPAGSGNALACSIAHFCKDNASATDAAFYAVKGRTHSLDVTKYELDDGVVFPSFLSLTWAVIADVDLGSESLRCLGSFRFDLAAVYRILCLRKHKGTIAYVPLDEEDDAAEWVRMPEDANYHLAVAVNLSHIGPSTHIAPEARLDDGAIHLIWTSGDTSMSTKMDLFDGFLKIEKGTHVDKPNFHVAKCKKIRLKPAQGDTSRISIDGEEVPNKPIVGTVVPRCLRVFVSPETALAAAPPAPAP